MNQRSRIPSEQDFARAKVMMRQREKQEAQLKKRIVKALRSESLQDVWVWLSEPVNVAVDVVFSTDKDLADADVMKLKSKVTDLVSANGFVNCVVRYHSHEFVLRKFNGNYGLYFR